MAALRAPARRALGPLLLVWLGIVIGIALLAAPVPFMVEQLERPEALSVNHQLFRMLSWTEFGLLALALVLAALTRPRPPLWLGLGVIALIVLVQGLVLLPELARRTDVVLAGAEPAPAPYHAIYVILELAKMALLGGLGLWRPLQPHGPSAAG